MTRATSLKTTFLAGLLLGVALIVSFLHVPLHGQSASISPSRMARTTSVDERFVSYNVEMVEVTGGRFWVPYRSGAVAPPKQPAANPVPGLDPNAFRMRPPIDLAGARLRGLARALGPAYMRVSGTWANSTYFHDEETPAPDKAPEGFGGAPKGYDAAAFGRDFGVFLPFIRKAAPGLLVLGPGSVGEGGLLANYPSIKSEAMLTASASGVDAFSYHSHNGVSQRCAGLASGGSTAGQTTPDAALTADWLSRTERDARFYGALRDRFAPGKPLWLTESGETACGGNPWASDRTSQRVLTIPASAERYTLASPTGLLSHRVTLNGRELGLEKDGAVPALRGIPTQAGEIDLPPASVTFLAVSAAGNPDCKGRR
jgi:hypothetical protein